MHTSANVFAFPKPDNSCHRQRFSTSCSRPSRLQLCWSIMQMQYLWQANPAGTEGLPGSAGVISKVDHGCSKYLFVHDVSCCNSIIGLRCLTLSCMHACLS